MTEMRGCVIGQRSRPWKDYLLLTQHQGPVGVTIKLEGLSDKDNEFTQVMKDGKVSHTQEDKREIQGVRAAGSKWSCHLRGRKPAKDI